VDEAGGNKEVDDLFQAKGADAMGIEFAGFVADGQSFIHALTFLMVSATTLSLPRVALIFSV
jgi:hypothetical protein